MPLVDCEPARAERMVLAATVAALVMACAAPPDDGSPTVMGSPEVRASASGLGSQPSPAAWQTLFDGEGTAALRGYGGDAFPADRWQVLGDVLRAVPGSGVDLITREVYGDFELEFEWRVAPGGNSGVMYRVLETAEPPWTTGPEYQVLDDDLHPDGSRPETSAGALYDLLAPADTRLEPVGAWNTGRIVVYEGRVEHWLNGDRVLAYGWDDPDTRDRIASSKFVEFARFMREPRGHIVLQHHGEEASFRRVRVRPLD